MALEATTIPVADDLPHPGCNCGRRRPAPPPATLLRGDLVIAARDRNREPELPAETVAHALATPVAPRLARYDVIIVASPAGETTHETRLAAEFARHEHRVFLLGDGPAAGRQVSASTLRRLPLPARGTVELVQALAELRRAETIEAAVVIVPDDLDPATARELRDRWGWHIVANAAATPLAPVADVRVAFDVAAAPEAPVLALPPGMSWPARWAALDAALRASYAKASVIILTHDNLAFNRMCLASVFENTEYPNFEVIVVDNGSTDGTVEELHRLATAVPNLRVIYNEVNAGFGPGNNQGLREATGEILVLLNNDTIVPHGWLTRLAHHLDDPQLALMGPATNRSCNESQIEIPYRTYDEYRAVARQQGLHHEGKRFSIRMPMMFCCAFRRDIYEALGPLDERFGIGMFEDEDYALRAKAAGYDTAWTPEVYVHHAYHASIGKLVPNGEYQKLARRNMTLFEEKWGICWERHRRPPAPQQAT